MPTFSKDFGRGHVFTMTLPDIAPEDVFKLSIKTSWSKGVTPSDPKINSPWKTWLNETMQDLANKWQTRLFFDFATIDDNNDDIWLYHPGKGPQKLNSKDAKILRATGTAHEQEKIALRPHDGSSLGFKKQLEAATSVYAAAHEIETLAQVPKPNGPLTQKVERTEGKTNIVVSAIDADILPTIPQELRRLHQQTDSNEQTLIYIKAVAPGWIKAWFRMREMEPGVGNWQAFEIKAPVEELKNNKAGQSAQAYARMLSYIMALAENLIPGSAQKLLAKLRADGAIIP